MAVQQDAVEITFTSSLDGALERALWYQPVPSGYAPLVVGLHTWSYDRYNQLEHMLPFCRERGWSLLLPEFRGPNLESNPRAHQACASDLAKQDVLDALAMVRTEFGAAGSEVFLLGGSGGGHMALMLAAHRPELWSGVSSWVPITDLAAWRAENPDYAAHVEACCGGVPGSNAEVDREYRDRSPINFTAQLARVKLSVHHGRLDRVVSYQHTMNLIREMERHQPRHLFFEVFDGAHDIRYDVAFRWFDTLRADVAEEWNRLTG